MYDFVIRNVRIVDGTGSPWRRGDVAVQDGKIARVGFVQKDGSPEIDGQDRYLTPGFIDIHCHTDESVFRYPQVESRILQGVTTELAGNCGGSAAPVHGGEPGTFPTMKGFLDAVDELHPSTNIAMLAGQGTIRAAVVGMDERPATPEEMEKMKALAAQCMEEGAFGLSSGLIYHPSCYADTNELIELCKAIRPYDGFYATHMRNEKKKLVDGVREALAIGTGAGVAVEISHHKCTWKPDWEVSVKTTTAMIEKARVNGLDVTCDQYPYIASATGLAANIPNWAFDGGTEKLLERLRDPETRERLRAECNESHRDRWDTIFVSYTDCEEDAWMAGMNITSIAEKLGGKDPALTVFDILLRSGNHAGEVSFSMCEEDVEYIMSKPYVMIGSDGWAYSMERTGCPHPRSFAAFVRVLAHYSRDRKLLSLEEGIRKMTGAPAAKLGLDDRGVIKKGMWADLVLLDREELRDTPDFRDPFQVCKGIRKVWVNGVLTAEDGRHTGARAGKALRKGIRS